MPFVNDLKPENNVFALFVSRSGHGKTTAAASFPKPEFMDFDGRIRGLIQNLHLFKDKISFEQFLPPKGWDQLYKYLDTLRNAQLFKISNYQTVVCDSLTALCNLMLNESIQIQQGKIIKNEKATAGTGLRVAGPSDYNYEAAATYQAFNILRNLTQYMNVIATAHMIPRYGKPPLRDSRGNIQTSLDGETVLNPYADVEEIGEKLAIREKIEANTLIFFNEIYQFEKETSSKGNKYYVNFESDLARSSLGLKGRHDITEKNFYEFWKSKVQEAAQQDSKVKEIDQHGTK